MGISSIDLFDQNACKVAKQVRLRCLHIINIQFSYTFFRISAQNPAPCSTDKALKLHKLIDIGL